MNKSIFNGVPDKSVYIAEALANGAFKNAKILIGIMKNDLEKYQENKI